MIRRNNFYEEKQTKKKTTQHNFHRIVKKRDTKLPKNKYENGAIQKEDHQK